MTGKFFPMQLMHKGIIATCKCIPKHVEFSSDGDVTFSSNHWANKSTTISYVIIHM